MEYIQNIISTFRKSKADTDREREDVRKQAYETLQQAKKIMASAARKMTKYHKLMDKAAGIGVSWVDDVVVPIVQEVNRRTGLSFDTSGGLRTFGLRSECPVFHKGEDGKVYSLVFTPRFENDSFSLRLDTGQMRNLHAEGTIGSLNGCNNVTEEVNTVEDILRNLKRRFPEITTKD